MLTIIEILKIMVRLDEPVESRAKRYVLLHSDLYFHSHEEVVEYCHLPKVLESYLNLVFFEDSKKRNYSIRERLRGNVTKQAAFVQLCLDSYRDYYRSRSNKTQSQEG